MNNSYLLVDLETTSLKIEDAKIKIFGAYDPVADKYFIYRWSDDVLAKIMRLLSTYKKIITFNGEKYDLPILENHGIPIKNYKHIDVYRIYKTKSRYLRSEGFNSYSLKNLTLTLGLDSIGKGDIDYEIFKRDCWTPGEIAEIIKYCKQDLLSTWKLFLYASHKLNYLTKFIAERDVDNDAHLVLRDDAYCYKALCNLSLTAELYDERPEYEEFPQSLTSTPKKKNVIDADVIVLPPIYLFTLSQFNLLGYICRCCQSDINEGKYHGRNHFTMNGFYCQKNQNNLSKTLENIYRKSLIDPDYKLFSELLFENLYSICTNAKYYATYNTNMVIDLNHVVRQQLKEICMALDLKGYRVFYVDSEELYLKLDVESNQTIKEAHDIINECIAKQQNYMPFPSVIFKSSKHYHLKYIQFFDKGKATPFMYKDKYVAITDHDTVKSRNTTMIERDKVYLDYINMI